MCKVLFVTYHYPPDIGAGSNRSNHVVRALRQRGIDVDVLTSQPIYPNPKLYQTYSNENSHDRESHGRVYRLFAFSRGYTLFPIIYRLFNQLVFLLLAGLFVLRRGKHYRVVMTSSPPFIINMIGVLAKRVHRCQWILEIRDLWPDSLLAVGKLSETHPLFKLLKRLERLFYRRCDTIVPVAPGMITSFIKSGIDQQKLCTITNGIPKWINKSKRDHVMNVPLKIIYIGTIGLAQDFAPLVEIARNNRDVLFEVIGEGMCKDDLKKEVWEKQLSNVVIKDGIVNKDEIIEAYLSADVGYIGLKNHDVFQRVIPSKLFEYGAIGIPIIYSGPMASDCHTIIRQFRLGRAITDVAEVDERYFEQLIEEYRQHARIDEFINQYSWETIGDRYYELLCRRCQHGHKGMHGSVESFYN